MPALRVSTMKDVGSRDKPGHDDFQEMRKGAAFAERSVIYLSRRRGDRFEMKVLHPPPRSGGGGPPEGRWRGPSLSFLCSVRKPRRRCPLHHASHGPPPPPRGGGKKSRGD